MGYRGKKQGRVVFLDEMRGLVIILMILFHLGYDLVHLFGVEMPFYQSYFVQYLIQPFIACTFTFISGTVCRFSRSNLKRGAMVFLLAWLMTAVTHFLMPDQVIWFGVLHMLGASMMLYALIERIWREGRGIPAFWSMLIFLLLFWGTYHISGGVLGFSVRGKGLFLRLPDFLYQSAWLAPLGFPGPGFFSSDYFPLIPWFFLFLAGTNLGMVFRQNAMPRFFYRSHIPLLEWLGKRSLPIYLLHQPITYGLLLLIFAIIEKTAV